MRNRFLSLYYREVFLSILLIFFFFAGSSCSKSSRRASQNSRSTHNPNFSLQSSGYVTSSRCFSRHSLSQAIPDDSISNFYPPADNYVSENDGTRSPKSLAQLCTDSLCRSLPYLDGELPPGLPPDVVDDIIDSLVKHNALNTTTLKILRNCEISSLRLAGCRGVTEQSEQSTGYHLFTLIL